jgi:mercuric ion transport protein
MPSFNPNASLFAGVLAAIGASVCCVGPLVLLMLGIGGAWFIAATLLFLGLAFRRLFRQQPVCVPGAACAEPIVLQRQRWIFAIVALLLLVLLLVPWLAPFFL